MKEEESWPRREGAEAGGLSRSANGIRNRTRKAVVKRAEATHKTD